MITWIENNSTLIWLLGVVSVVTFIVSLAAMPAVIIRIPADYFDHEHRPPSRWLRFHPVWRVLLRLGRNVLGVVLILGGIAMLALPGQGLLTLLAGFLLIELPGKYQLEKWLLRRRAIIGPMNWLRRRYGRVPLRVAGGRAEQTPG